MPATERYEDEHYFVAGNGLDAVLGAQLVAIAYLVQPIAVRNERPELSVV